MLTACTAQATQVVNNVVCVSIVSLALLSIPPTVWGRSVMKNDDKGVSCKLFYYFDTGTELCEHCSGLCDHAQIWNWEKQCQTTCPDYQTAKSCRPGDQYFDEQTRSCSPCLELCRHHEIRGTTPQCANLCPDYKPQNQTHTDTDLKISSDLSTQPSVEQIRNDSPRTGSRLQLLWILIIVAVFVIFVITFRWAVVPALCPHVFRRGETSLQVKYKPASVTDDAESGSGSAVQVPPKTPEPETQPGIRSQLVTTGN